MTFMTSLIWILLVSIISKLVQVFWLNCNRQDYIEVIGCLLMEFRVYNIGMAQPTIAQAQTNYHVLQFGHGNQVNAVT